MSTPADRFEQSEKDRLYLLDQLTFIARHRRVDEDGVDQTAHDMRLMARMALRTVGEPVPETKEPDDD